jgi:hypothetical protein
MKTSVALALVGLLADQSPDLSKPFISNVPDLTLKIRSTTDPRTGPWTSTLRTLYFKGARQRQEDVLDGKSTHFISIAQCDEHRTILLNEEAKTYAYQPIYDPSDYFRRAHQSSSKAAIEATTTTDSDDTGERRAIGPYVARHILTTRRTEHRSSGTVQLEERDGWYVDIPVDCHDWAARLELYDTTPGVPGTQMMLRGDGRRAYPIIETIQMRNGMFVRRDGQTIALTVTSTQELIEVTDQVLDTALFNIPPGYRPALARSRGGPDMSKPDTLTNRAELYWTELVAWANDVFR